MVDVEKEPNVKTHDCDPLDVSKVVSDDAKPLSEVVKKLATVDTKEVGPKSKDGKTSGPNDSTE